MEHQIFSSLVLTLTLEILIKAIAWRSIVRMLPVYLLTNLYSKQLKLNKLIIRIKSVLPSVDTTHSVEDHVVSP